MGKERLQIDYDVYRFNILTSAVANYNLGNFSEAKEKLSLLASSADRYKSGFLKYFRALLALTDGERWRAYRNLETAIFWDPEALPPYLLLALLYKEDKNIQKAIEVLIEAKKNVDDKSYAINYFLAGLYFEIKNYKMALEMYKIALRDITINDYEAKCKIFIAVCYAKLGDIRQANKWRKEAFEELGEEYADLREYINDIYVNNI